MLTVPEAARRVGTRYLIDEADLEAMDDASTSLPLPRSLRKTWTGRDMLDAVALIRELPSHERTARLVAHRELTWSRS